MHTPDVRIECLIAILRQNTYMPEQITKGFGIMNTYALADLVYALGTGSTSMSTVNQQYLAAIKFGGFTTLIF